MAQLISKTGKTAGSKKINQKSGYRTICISLRLLILSFILLLVSFAVSAQDFTVSGRVLDAKEQIPIEFVVVQITESEQYAITDKNGKFSIERVHTGNVEFKVSILGYATTSVKINLQAPVPDLLISLEKSTLALNEVIVTAQPKEEQSTVYKIGSVALEHEQILDISQIQSLLPGGKTSTSNDLTESQRLYIRSESASEKGNTSFGTALEVDGVRLQNNASFDAFDPYGVDTRNISTVNIESVEVITGIASVEHGDFSNGIVKINTRKGRTPINATVTINPNTKQFGLSKGFVLGENRGTLNTSGEHTRSVSQIMSPYTTYERNSLSLTHEKYFKNRLTLTSGLTFNVGGYNSESDPDLFTGTYTKRKDNVVRGQIAAKWFLNKNWISNLAFSTSVNYSNKLTEEKTRESSAATQAANHATQKGYFIATDYDENPNAPITLMPTGYWYEIEYYDNKMMDFTAKLKTDWVRSFADYTNKILLGLDYSNSGNLGKGTYYDDMRYAPTWRPYVLSEVPNTNNIALFLEDKLTKVFGRRSKVMLVAGVRSDNTYINQSEYGWVGNISPRVNVKYEQNNDKLSFVRNFNVYAGWGKSVKLPSLGVLNPEPSYSSRQAFASTSNADNVAYYAYYNQASTTLYNPALKYQYNNQVEIGFGANIKGTKINVSAYRNKTVNPYIYESVYFPYSYKKTNQTSLENSAIPIEDRRFTIDQTTGIVTIHDVSGTYASYELDYEVKNKFQSRRRYKNGSPATRMGVDWIIDFARVGALSTSFRVDGNFYYYKGLEEHIFASTSGLLMANGEPFKYIGYYTGSAFASESSSSGYSNGSISKQVNTNLTIKTHIPKVRMVVTLRIESSLYNYSQRLSEYSGGERGFILENKGDYFGDDTDIYNRNEFVGIYPLYYTTWEDMDTKIPFEEKFLWAKENDPELYTELSRLVEKTYYKNYFRANKISAYYSANINLTKEIGDIASISFFARNFTQNLGHVKSSRTASETSLYNSYIPDFYYGISVRLKI
jgi:outer membrane receptor protein involved in Fe transport